MRREAFKLLWNADLDSQPLCSVRFRPGGDSPLQHNCSGKHAAFPCDLPKDGLAVGELPADRTIRFRLR